LHVYGELLLSLGTAFLRQRYAVILDRKLAKASLRFRLLLDGIKGYAFFTVDGTGLVSSWNRGAARIFGHRGDEVMGQHFSLFFTPEDIRSDAHGKLLLQAQREGSANDQRWQVRKDGTRFFAEGSLTALGEGRSREFGRLTHDVTDRLNAEEALRETQKLESIGLLASGIAHDFNNLLCVIMCGVSFAKMSLSPDDPALPSLTTAEEASEKAADLTHQLLAYGGQGKFIVTRFDLSLLIRDMLKLLRTSIPKSVDLQLALQPDLPWIEADASQIQQVVMNLVINGAESIGPDGGVLRVSTESAIVGKRADGQPEIEVSMEVRDSGSGMTEATQARIFDPFFTTKFAGRGLGLAAVSGIVRGHEGRMQVESAVGKGSTFRVSFPGIEKRVQAASEPAVLNDGCGSGTVLVVDDEPGLRRLAQAILERGGYKVLAVEDGREAVEVFQKHADTVTAILLDMTMPAMGGAEVFRQIRAIRADVPIVVATGYSEAATRGLFGSGTKTGFVQKPYTAERLCESIHTTTRTAKSATEAGP
jgi:PAS domain S-box-containing protein